MKLTGNLDRKLTVRARQHCGRSLSRSAFALFLYQRPKYKHQPAMQIERLAILLFSSLLTGCANPISGNWGSKTCNNTAALSDESRWYTADDLPTDWVYNNIPTFIGEGHFQLEINNVGKVIRCKIERSSDAKIIDQSICLNLQRRAAFTSTPQLCADLSRYVTYRATMAWNLNSEEKPRISLKRTKNES
ncbi:hypothetical protein [Sphingorhabdus sp.]|jgi:hypothetical protein|uniref:hypothetical protein n=1 Tax=Sphingorhabdus sp. TaxID=1902408 RepID=UPI00378313FB